MCEIYRDLAILMCIYLSKIELVHGHNLGTAIKDYIQNENGLSEDMERIYPEIPSLMLSDKGLGSTVVRFKRP